jgi:hypothetical protein
LSSEHLAAAANPAAAATGRMRAYSLLDALRLRRSRRFAPGMSLNGGPLAYQAHHLDPDFYARFYRADSKG